LTGTCVAVGGGQGPLLGGVLGAVDGVVGCFLGYEVRTWLVKALGMRDIYVALLEDLVAVGGSLGWCRGSGLPNPMDNVSLGGVD
jgi:uncharacterized membrane protein